MEKNTRLTWVITGTLLYTIGAVLGLWLLVVSTWGDLEAMLFDTALSAKKPLRSLNCPILITTSDIGVISASFENATDFERTVLVQARTTMGHIYLIQEQRDEIQIKSGESYYMEWEVFPVQATSHRVILTRIYQYQSFSIPSRTGSCGIMVVDIPQMTGKQVLTGSLTGSFLLMAAGVLLRGVRNKNRAEKHFKRRKVTNGMLFLGASIFIGILISVMLSPLLGVVMVALCVLTIISIFSFSFRGKL
jgi:hypothetical protein